MKKLFFLAALSFSMIAANAQFGLKGGGNLSNWHGDNFTSSDVDPLFGFYIGPYYNASITSHFSVQSEVVFATAGIKDANSSEKIQTNYINISVVPRYNQGCGWFIGTGPELGLLMSAKDKYQGNSVNVKDELKKSNFSWAFMTGYDFKMGFGIYTRYSLGLSDIDNGFSGGSIKQNVWSFGVRYNFNMSGGK